MAYIQKVQRAKGLTYRIKVSVGYDNNNKQITKSITWAPEAGMTDRQIEKELNKRSLEFEKKVQDGLSFDNVKFADFSELWLKDYAEKQCSPKYISESKRMLVVINKEIGHLPLPKLRKAHLQDFYNKLGEEMRIIEKKTIDDTGKATIEKIEKKKSSSTILHYHSLISTILTKATQWDYISRNICIGKGMELPKRKKYQPNYLQETDVFRLAECLQDEPIEYKTMLMLLLYTGMRNGEALGLEWNDINFDNNLVSINKSSQYLGKVGIFTKEPKNASSVRINQVVPELMELLRQYKTWQSKKRLKQGKLWKSNPLNTDEKLCDNWNTCEKNGKSVYCGKLPCKDHKDIDRLFTQFNGIPMHPDTPLIYLKKFTKKYDLPDINIHSLRHTNVSLMIMQGIPLPTVARLVGHSSTATTSKIYSHSIQTAEQLAIEKVANVINPSRKAK